MQKLLQPVFDGVDFAIGQVGGGKHRLFPVAHADIEALRRDTQPVKIVDKVAFGFAQQVAIDRGDKAGHFQEMIAIIGRRQDGKRTAHTERSIFVHWRKINPQPNFLVVFFRF